MVRTTTAEARLGPEFTPPVLKWLIIITASLSIFSGATEGLLYYFFRIPGLEPYLSLSFSGLKQLYLWQPLTYMFFYNTAAHGITLFWMIGLSFYLYILWVMGSLVVERVGSTSFLKMYLLSGVGAGTLSVLIGALIGQEPWISGPTASLLALLVVWTMLQPKSVIFLFFVIPVKARFLVMLLLGFLALRTLSNGDVTHFTFYFLGTLIGYLYAVMIWELEGPYEWSRRFDDAAWQLGRNLRSFSSKNNKIISIKSGAKQDSDERFMDQMLEKISKHGEGSLTFWERLRMNRISKKRS